MNNDNTKKTRTAVSSITPNTIGLFIKKYLTIKQAALKADISSSLARRLIVAIKSGESDESIVNTKKKRPAFSDPSLRISIRGILDRELHLYYKNYYKQINNRGNDNKQIICAKGF
ncbi:hypothetical protein CDIK_1120 [Cucumispora dikerogammari]|nr:hypothetical protein CDIK_1120 [Cucumispora dikerogammari]